MYKFLARFYQTFVGPQLDFRVRLFNILAIGGATASAVMSLFSAAANGSPLNTFKSLKAECTAKIDKLNSQLATLRESEVANRDREQLLAHAKTVLSESVTEKELVDMLIKKIHVFPDKHLEITWKVAGFAVVY